MPLTPGTCLGPYEILSPLGAGGMGEVYRARDTRLGRDVAVKVLPDHLAGDHKVLARFESEARAVAALSHPNILALYDVGQAGSVHFAVAELLEGETLRSLLSRGPLPLRRALAVARQIADALAAAHEKGIVHRDLKPENVFLSRDDHAKVLDFGLARHDPALHSIGDSLSPTASVLTQDGEILGTVPYMSPEQARGLRVDFRSDQFSLGSLLYEMLSGKRPFRGATAADVLAAIIRDEPEPLSRLLDGLPPQLLSVLDRCLAKEPSARYDSSRDLARDLDACWLRLSGAPEGITAPASAGAAASEEAPETRNRNGRRVALGIAAAAVLLAATALLVVRGRGTASTPEVKVTKGAPGVAIGPVAGPAALEPKRVVVAVFENRTGDKELDDLGTILSEWLTDGLAAAGFCEIAPTASVIAIHRNGAKAGLGEADRLRDLAERTGAGLVVSGAVYTTGGPLRIQVRVTEGGTGRVVRTLEPVTASRADPMPAVETVRRLVVDAAAAHLLDPLTRLVHVGGSPPKYEAIREKLAGDRIGGNWATDDAESIDRYRRAIEIDPDYDGARIELVGACLSANRWEEAAAQLDTLEKRRGSLSPAVAAMLDGARAVLRGRWDEAVLASREGVRLSPGDAHSHYTLANDAYRAGRPREAVEALRRPVDWRLFLAPENKHAWWYFHYLAASLHALGKHEEELAEARRSRGLYPDVGLPRVDEARALAALGRLDELDRAIDDAMAMTMRLDGYSPGTVMRLAIQELHAHGRREAALVLASRYIAWIERRPDSSGSEPRARRRVQEARAGALVLAERWTEARDVLQALRLEKPDAVGLLSRLAWVTLRAGNRAEAARLDAELGRVGGPYLFGQPAFGRACYAAALGNREEAVNLLRDALSQGFPPLTSYSPAETLRHRLELEPLRGYPPFEELLKPKG